MSRISAKGMTRGLAPPVISISACKQHVAQLLQRVGAGDGGEEQPVRLERAADLHEDARRVVGEMQRQRRDGEIDDAGSSGRRSSGAATKASPGAAKAGSVSIRRHPPDLAGSLQSVCHEAGIAMDLDRFVEVTFDDAEPLRQLVGRHLQQEIRRRLGRFSVRSRFRSTRA